MPDNTYILDYLGTSFFAYNGTRITLKYGPSKPCAVFFGLITAVGGGTIRDTLHRRKPFWIVKPEYVVISVMSAIIPLLNVPKL